MSNKSRIPIDIDHDPTDSIGYLNNFDTSSGDLICSGAVVLTNPDDPNDPTTDLVTKILNGVPYEASIEFDDYTLQFIPEGSSVIVNGRVIDGPVTVASDWTLKAVAITKFGCDSDTSTDIQLSKEKSGEAKEGFFIRFAKSKMGIDVMNANKETEKKVEAVEAPVEAKAVEAVVKATEEVSTQLSEVKVEVAAVPVAAVEAIVEEVKKDEPVAEVAVTLSKTSVDPREEFKTFVGTFGAEKAAMFFSEGLSYSDALTKFSVSLKAENEDLKKRLAAVDRGAESVVRFSKVDTESAKGSRTAKPVTGVGLSALVSLPNKK
jgi:hypothetical protein